MFRRSRERVPVYKPADSLGSACIYFAGEDCGSRLELLVASGETGGVDKDPLVTDCDYALYGRVCMGGEEQVVVELSADSPNANASIAEMIGRTGMYKEQRIVLNTPPGDFKY